MVVGTQWRALQQAAPAHSWAPAWEEHMGQDLEHGVVMSDVRTAVTKVSP